MAERLFDFDPTTGLKTTFRYNEENDSFALTYSQNVSAILDDNKRAQADFNPKGDVWHAASVPVIVQMKWKTDHGVEMWNPDHKQAVLKLLDSYEYAYLKRAPIQLGRGAGRQV